MANKKKELFRPGTMTEGKRNIIQGLLQKQFTPKALFDMIFAKNNIINNLTCCFFSFKIVLCALNPEYWAAIPCNE